MRDYDGRIIVPYEQPGNRNLPDDEPELQWLEDGVNYLCGLVFEVVSKTFVLLILTGVRLFQAYREWRA